MSIGDARQTMDDCIQDKGQITRERASLAEQVGVLWRSLPEEEVEQRKQHPDPENCKCKAWETLEDVNKRRCCNCDARRGN